MYHDRGENEQVVRTVSLSGPDFEAVRQLLVQLLSAQTVQSESQPSQNRWDKDPRSLVEFAKRILEARRRRTECLSKPMFGEPAWDMLLALYTSGNDQARHSVTRLTAVSGAPPTTALRWLDYLQKERLVSRQPNPTDGRSDFVELTDKGRSAMDTYLSGTLESFV
jgi:DNA-binding MarR family transcriptional regulator